MAAKIIPIKKATSWSFSRYSDYVQCPLKFKLKHIDKLKEPPNKAMERGSDIHTMAEKYIKGITTVLPDELKLFEGEFKLLKKQFQKKSNGMSVEDNWSFTKDWDETRWDDWIGCWVRIKLDCAHQKGKDTIVITDWKTGKFRSEDVEVYVEQLELYALAALLLHPQIKKVMPRLVYLDQGVIYPDGDNQLVFTQDDVERLKELWSKRIRPMFNDATFAPRPNDKCHWCYFSSSKNGPCKY